MKPLIFFSLILMSFNSHGQKTDTVNLKSYFGEFIGGICIYDLKTKNCIKYNPKQCARRYSPCSTFKIPNSLIGLETGIIKDTSFIIEYDSTRHPKDSFKLANEPFKHWYEDLSLKLAFKYSCVWYYQELARRVGKNRMQNKVENLNYGNKDISSGIDNFWVCGSMEISIDEQIEFLKQFYSHKLKGFSDKNIDAVKSIMLYETTSDYKLYGKTGYGDCWNNKSIGWFVGFVETDTGTKIFAMNILVKDLNDLKNNYRIELTKKVLRDLKIIK